MDSLGKERRQNLRVNLKEKMKERSVKPIDLAIAADISVSFVYKLMAGTRNPNVNQAKRIADFLGSSIEYLFFGTNLDETGNYQAATKEAI
jgi:putative transcriptional regulator